jgi:hypothetical protein
VGILQKFFPGAAQCDGTVFQNIRSVGYFQGIIDVLFDQQNGRSLGVDLLAFRLLRWRRLLDTAYFFHFFIIDQIFHRALVADSSIVDDVTVVA